MLHKPVIVIVEPERFPPTSREESWPNCVTFGWDGVMMVPTKPDPAKHAPLIITSPPTSMDVTAAVPIDAETVAFSADTSCTAKS